MTAVNEDLDTELTPQDIQTSIQAALDWAGVSLEELVAQARNREFATDEAEVVWFRISDFLDQKFPS